METLGQMILFFFVGVGVARLVTIINEIANKD